MGNVLLISTVSTAHLCFPAAISSSFPASLYFHFILKNLPSNFKDKENQYSKLFFLISMKIYQNNHNKKYRSDLKNADIHQKDNHLFKYCYH